MPRLVQRSALDVTVVCREINHLHNILATGLSVVPTVRCGRFPHCTQDANATVSIYQLMTDRTLTETFNFFYADRNVYVVSRILLGHICYRSGWSWILVFAHNVSGRSSVACTQIDENWPQSLCLHLYTAHMRPNDNPYDSRQSQKTGNK